MKFKCDRCGNENPSLGNMKHCCWYYYFKSTGQDPHLPKGEKVIKPNNYGSNNANAKQSIR